MMRLLVLGIAITAFCLWITSGCAGGADDMGSADGDADSDADTDSDTGGVPIEYPQAINFFENPNSLMTGPISPPPEQVLGEDGSGEGPPGPDPTLDLEEEDPDGGEPGEEL